MMIFIQLAIAILDLIKTLVEKTDKIREKAVALRERKLAKRRLG